MVRYAGGVPRFIALKPVSMIVMNIPFFAQKVLCKGFNTFEGFLSINVSGMQHTERVWRTYLLITDIL